MLLAQYNFISFPWWFILGYFVFWIAAYVLAIWGYIVLIRRWRKLAIAGLILSLAPEMLSLFAFAHSKAYEYLVYGNFHSSSAMGRRLSVMDWIELIVAHSLWSVPLIVCSLLRLRKRP